MALLLKHQTVGDFIARLREAYRDSQGERTVQLARFIVARVDAGDLTDAELREAFGKTVSQWNTMKTKLRGLQNARNQILSAIGE